MRKVFVPGQRWLSETEPELGLGTVLSATPNQVTVVFRATGTTRQYSIENAPLKRGKGAERVGSATRKRFVPDRCELGRVVVVEAAQAQHDWPGVAERWP